MTATNEYELISVEDAIQRILVGLSSEWLGYYITPIDQYHAARHYGPFYPYSLVWIKHYWNTIKDDVSILTRINRPDHFEIGWFGKKSINSYAQIKAVIPELLMLANTDEK